MTDPRQQENPFCVQIEMTEGCNLRCPYCGINGIRGQDPDFKFLKLPEAVVLAQRLADTGWNCRVEFAMHGEPTLNPQCAAIVSTFRRLCPKNYFLMESNGVGIVGSPGVRVAALFSAGLDCLALDEYSHVGIVGSIRLALKNVAVSAIMSDAGVRVFEYPEDKDGNPHQRSRLRRLVFVAPIDTASHGTHATLNNHAGSGAPPNLKGLGRPCAKVFREIAIRWDGNVAICCNDWRGEFRCGNAIRSPLEGIWQGAPFRAARRLLLRGFRDFVPCARCDATSYRVGLLPDGRGKMTLPQADEEDRSAIEAALRRGPYSAMVLRPWEKP